MRRKRPSFVSCCFGVGLILASLFSCNPEVVKEDIGEKISTPYALAADGSYFHVLMGNANQDYKTGSILTVDTQGEIQGAVETPSLGQSMIAVNSGNKKYLLAAFERLQDKDKDKIKLYGLDDPQKPTLKKTWEVDCHPAALTARDSYDKFALSCYNGNLFVGKLDEANEEASSLSHIRSYPSYLKKAMYIDTSNETLYLFVTDKSAANLRDKAYKDSKTYNPETNVEEGEGEDDIPDDIGKSRYLWSQAQEKTNEHQFISINLKAQETAGFPFKKVDETADELHWMYFDVGQSPTDNSPQTQLETGQKFYRTNFWEAQPHPSSSNKFYLSHRGINTEGGGEGEASASNIIEVTIQPDSAEKKLTRELLSFKRVYGFAKEDKMDKSSYLGSFLLYNTEDGSTLGIVNHFRDPRNFSSSYYALGVVDFSDNSESRTKMISSTKAADSFFGLARLGNYVITSSHYNNQLIIYELKNKELALVKRIP